MTEFSQPKAMAIMVMGTGSDVGKSLIVAGLCRLFARRGLRVHPFKPQNMSNNAAVTCEGGEIGRAQALQARAALCPPSVHMNPVLLKPEAGNGAQIIVQGQRIASLSAREYFRRRADFMPAILESFRQLQATCDLVIVEGAGSPAEVNLRDGDLANMGFARAADIPAILVGDVHRGGVIASVIGTWSVLDENDSGRLKAFLINKFHGDVTLFNDGVLFLEDRTGRPCLGVIPHFEAARDLPAEDVLALDQQPQHAAEAKKIVVLRLPRIANFDDLDPLRLEPGVNLVMLEPGRPIPGDAALVILPGSKSTLADLAALRLAGWDIDLAAHVRRGGAVLGLCGGYQMLGQTLSDPDGIEGSPQTVAGLGHLAISTQMHAQKTVRTVKAVHCSSGHSLMAYEIHVGTSAGADCARPFARIAGEAEGAISADAHIMGTYLHGLFANDFFRRAFLDGLGIAGNMLEFEGHIEKTLNGLADHLERHMDVQKFLDIAANHNVERPPGSLP